MKKDLIDLAAAKAKLVGVAIAALAVGGTAAAVGGISFTPVDSSTDVTVSPTATATESPDADATDGTGDESTATTQTQSKPEPTDGASPAVTQAAPACPDGVQNHGQYVSGVARDKTLSGSEHGKAVSAAAKSDCGKAATAGSDGDTPDANEASDPPEAPDADSSDDGAGRPEKATKEQSGHGHAGEHGKKPQG